MADNSCGWMNSVSCQPRLHWVWLYLDQHVFPNPLVRLADESQQRWQRVLRIQWDYITYLFDFILPLSVHLSFIIGAKFRGRSMFSTGLQDHYTGYSFNLAGIAQPTAQLNHGGHPIFTISSYKTFALKCGFYEWPQCQVKMTHFRRLMRQGRRHVCFI